MISTLHPASKAAPATHERVHALNAVMKALDPISYRVLRQPFRK